MPGSFSSKRGGGGRGHTREVNGTVVVCIDFVDHVLQLRLGRVLAERAHDGAQLLGCDLACSGA